MSFVYAIGMMAGYFIPGLYTKKMKKLNPLLHQELRLSIISFLANVEWGEFNKLPFEAANYIKIEKSFKNNYPLTRCRMTDLGRDELESYIQTLKSMLDI